MVAYAAPQCACHADVNCTAIAVGDDVNSGIFFLGALLKNIIGVNVAQEESWALAFARVTGPKGEWLR